MIMRESMISGESMGVSENTIIRERNKKGLRKRRIMRLQTRLGEERLRMILRQRTRQRIGQRSRLRLIKGLGMRK
jgi:hypothetical protein